MTNETDTETANTTETGTETTETGTETTETGTETTETAADRRTGNAEAARYRHRLREAETARDGLAEELTAARARATEDAARIAALEHDVARYQAIAEHPVPADMHRLVRGDNLEELRESAAALSVAAGRPGVVRASGTGDGLTSALSWSDALRG